MTKDLVADHVERCKRLTPKQITALRNEWGDAWAGNWDEREAVRFRGRLVQDTETAGVGWNVGDVASDVAVALSAKGKISEVDFELLVAPWASVMGRTWEA